MQQKYILYWQRAMQNSTKVEFFNTFKNDYKQSFLFRRNQQTKWKKKKTS